MKEVVVISGKGGTGKTSIVAALAALAGRAVLADCDVDAADLHLIMGPRVVERHEFRCGHQAIIRQADCIRCGACLVRCRFDAVLHETGVVGEETFAVDPTACEGCGVCVWSCPVKAIDFVERSGGEWYVSDTRFGPLVHARLIPGGENSGKLVSTVREAARSCAAKQKLELILVDGPPGVGCSVIASISGASLVLVVTEPTLSGEHDMMRVLELTRHFRIPTVVCVNKWDINPEQTEIIERRAMKEGSRVAGRVRYDRAFTDAQIQGCSIAEMPPNPTGADLRAIWKRLCSEIAH
ncbi:MAG: ATP-binding protein [Kiritimatiellia bacterium]|nr:ATP-binding protein [Kiritimatiellia bacterium]